MGTADTRRVVRLDGLAGGRGSAPTLWALARMAVPHADAARAVRRMGRVVAAATNEARVAGLSAHVAPGDRVMAGGIHATVTRVDCAVAVIATDRPGIRPDDTVELAGPPPRVDVAWLGRAVDASGLPVDGGEAPVASPLPDDDAAPRRTDRPVVTGVGAFDALVPVRPGEAWAVLGPVGSGRTSTVRMIGGCGDWDAVVVCSLAPRSRERAGWLVPDPRWLTVVTHAEAGAAECAAAVALATHAAADLARRHQAVVLLIDGAERLGDAMPSVAVPDVVTFTAWRAPSDPPCPAGHEGAVVLDGALAARGHHPAIDLAATLALSPAPDDDRGVHADLRAMAADGGADALLAALRQSPGGDAAAEHEPEPGAILTRAALAGLADGST